MLTNPNVVLDKARADVVIEATWELEALALLLPTLTTKDTSEAVQAGYQVRCVASRIKELASILMGGIGDASESTEELKRRLSVATT